LSTSDEQPPEDDEAEGAVGPIRRESSDPGAEPNDVTANLWARDQVNRRELERPDGNVEASDTARQGNAAGDTTPGVVPTKVCPNCSVAERTTGQFCPHCGASYARGSQRPTGRLRSLSRKAKFVITALLVLLIAGGVTTALVIDHNNGVARERAERVRIGKAERAKREAEAARRAEEQRIADEEAAAAEEARLQEEQDEAMRSIRRSLVRDLRKAITKDARKRVDQGILEGPIYGTQCDPVGGGNESDLDATTGKYDCLAYNVKNDDGTIEGYRFTSTVNFEDFSYTWRLGG